MFLAILSKRHRRSGVMNTNPVKMVDSLLETDHSRSFWAKKGQCALWHYFAEFPKGPREA